MISKGQCYFINSLLSAEGSSLIILSYWLIESKCHIFVIRLLLGMLGSLSKFSLLDLLVDSGPKEPN